MLPAVRTRRQHVVLTQQQRVAAQVRPAAPIQLLAAVTTQEQPAALHQQVAAVQHRITQVHRAATTAVDTARAAIAAAATAVTAVVEPAEVQAMAVEAAAAEPWVAAVAEPHAEAEDAVNERLRDS